MRRAAMYGMVGAMTLTFGTIVIPSENFVRQNNRGVQESVIPAVSKEVEAPTVEDVTQTEAVDAQNEADSTNTVNAAAGNAAGPYAGLSLLGWKLRAYGRQPPDRLPELGWKLRTRGRQPSDRLPELGRKLWAYGRQSPVRLSELGWKLWAYGR